MWDKLICAPTYLQLGTSVNCTNVGNVSVLCDPLRTVTMGMVAGAYVLIPSNNLNQDHSDMSFLVLA